MNWCQVVQSIGPYAVKIETQTGSGTGFLYAYNKIRTVCCIATARHVVKDADDWHQALRIKNFDLTKEAFLEEKERVILTHPRADSAVILFHPSHLELPEEPVHLRPTDSPVDIGEEVAWLGYPWLEPRSLCFFSGNISARRESSGSYLIDGAINGVSGGPVFFGDPENGIQIVGAVSPTTPTDSRETPFPDFCSLKMSPSFIK